MAGLLERAVEAQVPSMERRSGRDFHRPVQGLL